MKHKTIQQLRDNLKKVLKRARPKQLKKLRKAYHGKRLKKWWSDYANADGCNTIAELKDFEVHRKLDENTEFNPETDVLAKIHFQEGPIKECGVNGVCNEDLIVMAIRRLECFQNSEFKCRENACAITKLEEALLWLRKRTMGRENRGVEGTIR